MREIILEEEVVEDHIRSDSRQAKETLQQQEVKKYGAYDKNAQQRMKKFRGYRTWKRKKNAKL